MIKVSIVGIAAVILSIIWAVKRANARKLLAEYDAGTRCIGCEGTNVQVANGVVQCMQCGHAQPLATLRAVKLSESEIAAMSRPDGL
jgi:hypothetical protein